MTVIINALGAPSCGKTSLSVKLFAKLKELNLNVEYSPEVVKTWCYEQRKVNKYDQYYLFGSEVHQQSCLFNSVDIIISDSSPILAAFYNYYYNNRENSLSPACHEFYKKAAEDNIKVLNFLLTRTKPYNPHGRYQTEEQADDVAQELKAWLTWEGYDYIMLDCPDDERLGKVMEKLKEITGDFDGMSLA